MNRIFLRPLLLFLFFFVNGVSNAGIIIDGDPSDWANIPVLISDPVGDTEGATDIVSIKVANDENLVYFLLTYTSPPGEGVGLFLDTDLNPATGCPVFTIGMEYGISLSSRVSEGIGIGDARDCAFNPSDFPGQYVGVISGNVIEASVSISTLEILTPGLTAFDVIGTIAAVGASRDDTSVGRYTLVADIALDASELAKRVAGGDYQRGAKGFDWQRKVFVESDEIKTTGYHWDSENRATIDNVLDCSGLVFWSYNKAFGATKYSFKDNPVSAELAQGADGQFRHNSRHVDENDLRPGDLLFFDFQPGIPDPKHEIDHVAMYVGCCGPDGVSDVVEAFSPGAGIKWSRKDQLVSQNGFKDFGRITEPKEGIRFQAHSSVGLVVTDPDGFTITPQTLIVTDREELREIPGELYYSQSDIDDNGNPDDLVAAPALKTGVYLVQVEPKPNTAPTDTYSLKVETVGSTITLAQDVPISDIPSEWYGIKITGSDITQITAIVVDIKPGEFPNSINPKSKGVIPVAILTTDTFDATTVDPLSVRFGPNKALEAHKQGHVEDVDKDGDLDLLFHFKTQETGINCGNTHVAITGKTTDGQEVAGVDSIQTVGCK